MVYSTPEPRVARGHASAGVSRGRSLRHLPDGECQRLEQKVIEVRLAGVLGDLRQYVCERGQQLSQVGDGRLLQRRARPHHSCGRRGGAVVLPSLLACLASSQRAWSDE